ncbi:MAG: serine hydrolase [Cyclobacteriaceae bacterium]|nr:serine hydrolase [Cyclobacteriaceae bacterium]
MIKLTRCLFILAILLGATSQAPAQSADKVVAGVSTDRLKRLDAFVKSEIDKGNLSGVVTRVMRNGTLVYQSTQGYKNIEEKIAMKTNDIFFIQSMTKPVITTAFMMLYEEGYFQLTDPVSKYLPAFKDLRVIKDVNEGANGATVPMESEITIAQLLSHTSGLTHGLGQSQLEKDFMKGYFIQPYPDIKARAANITKFPLLAQPGMQWNYSAGHDVVSVLIEQFSGMSANDFLIERIFKPLGMKDTGYNLTKEQQARVAKVYSKEADGKLIPLRDQPKMEGNTIWSGVNGLFSTPADYMNFCQMLLNGGKWNGKQLLSRKTVDLMSSNLTGNLFKTSGEGFGLGVAVMVDVPASMQLGSNGIFYWAGAYNTHFFIDPKEKLIAGFFTQEAHFTNFYHAKLRQLVYQALAD